MRIRWQWLAASLLILNGCDAPETDMTATQARVDWPRLSEKKVVFAHQSVGANILSGVESLAKRDDVNLLIEEQRAAPEGAGIAHFSVGRNGDPLGKIQDFSATMDAGAADGTEIALLKLCYIDFNANTDAGMVANAYINTLDALSEKHPSTIFVAVTAPLATVQTGPKAWIKKLMGKQPAQYIENRKRSEFNQIIRAHFSTTNHLFDLARIESGTDGKRTVFQINEQEIEALDPALTDDGGHLNARGERLAAAAFLNLIASLPAL